MAGTSAAVTRLGDRIARAVRGASSNLAHLDATVTAVDAATGAVTVNIQGDTFVCPYYPPQPAVGQVVGVLFRDGSPIVLGALQGIPSV